MGILFKRYVLLLFVALMSCQVVRADEPAGEAQFLSQNETVLLEDLDNERGKGGVDITTLNKSYVGAVLRDSSAITNTNEGANSISGDAVTGNSGITDVIQNTGNNVIIQNSVTLNMTIMP